MCNHNPNNSDTSVVIESKKWFGVYPRKYIGVCKECKKILTFTSENGVYCETNKESGDVHK